MSLIVYEWRKLFRLTALWAFLGLSLLFNALLILTLSEWDRTFLRDTSADAALLGQRVDETFLDGLAALPETENRAVLLQSVTGLEDIFETYDTAILERFYTDVVKNSPTAAAWMTWKYDLLAARVDHLAETDAGMDLYAGPVTQGSHQFLFGTLMRSVVGEAAIAAMLGTLYLLGYEGMHKTESLACASRIGRRLRRTKVLASLAASPAFLALVAAPTLGLYFARFDYRGLWSASVSSQFNYLTDMLLMRPFLTWGDFTVARYLAAVLVLGVGLTAAFSLLAALCGTLVRNPYLAALALGISCFGGLGIASVLGNLKLWVGYVLSCFQPAIVWLCCGGWFTELGLNAVLPWQETIAVAGNLVLLGIGTALALRRFQRKDVLA